MVITNFKFQEVLSNLEGITLIVAYNTVKTSTYITPLLPHYENINISILPLPRYTYGYCQTLSYLLHW